MSSYDQIPTAAPTGGRWPSLIAPVIAAAIVLALGLLLVTLTSFDASEEPRPAAPATRSISR